MKSFASVLCFSALLVGSVKGQEVSPVAFNIGAGFTEPVGATGRNLDVGWNIQGGGGFNFGPYVGVLIDLNYNSFGINSGTLSNLGFPGGDVHIFSATLDPIVHLTPHSHFDIYATGGGGIYHQYQEFTQPTAVGVTGFNPFFGFYPTVVGGNQVLASYSVNKPGIDAGMGIAFGTKWHGKLFGEARYDRIFIGNYHTDYVPVTFGFRW